MKKTVFLNNESGHFYILEDNIFYNVYLPADYAVVLKVSKNHKFYFVIENAVKVTSKSGVEYYTVKGE